MKSPKISIALLATTIVALTTAMFHFGHQESSFKSTSSDGITASVHMLPKSGAASDHSWKKLENGLIQRSTAINIEWELLGNSLQGDGKNDYFGQCVAMSKSGNVIAVGNGSISTGRVKVYGFNQEGEIWEQLGSEILSGDVRPQFTDNGLSIAMNTQGDIIVIGAPHNNNGHVRIFRYGDGQWQQQGQALDGAWEDAEDYFGKSVGINGEGNRIVVGAPLSNDNGFWSGHTKVFEYKQNTNLWEQLGSDIVGDDGFNWSGDSVDMNTKGDIVVIGAPLNDGNSGHARIYRYMDGNWQQEGQDLSGEEKDDSFGSSVRINGEGNRVVVGGPFNDDNGSDSGHAKVFEYHLDTKLWEQLGSDIVGEDKSDFSGHSVDINDEGDVVVIGDGNYGHSTTGYKARIFRYMDGQWQQEGHTLDEDKGKYDKYYRTSVSINGEGNRAVLGADRNDDNGINSGRTKVFEFREVSKPASAPNDDPIPASPSATTSTASSHHSTSVLMILTMSMTQFLCRNNLFN